MFQIIYHDKNHNIFFGLEQFLGRNISIEGLKINTLSTKSIDKYSQNWEYHNCGLYKNLLFNQHRRIFTSFDAFDIKS